MQYRKLMPWPRKLTVLAVLLTVVLVAGLTTQASATTGAPDRPTGLTAELNDGGVLLSWDAPDEPVDSWQVKRKIHPAETAHTVIATVDGELNEWTDTDLTAGDRRYKIAAVRDSLTSRLSRVAKLMIDEPPSPDAGHHYPSPRGGAPDREGGRRCVYPCCEHRHCHARHVDEPRQQPELGEGHARGQWHVSDLR